MSNQQHARARAGQNGQRPPSQTEILSVMAGGVQAIAQMGSQLLSRPQHPPGQRWQCAVCFGARIAWESKHTAEIATVSEAYAGVIEKYNEAVARAQNPDLPQPDEPPGPPPSLLQYADMHFAQTDHPIPQVFEAVTIAHIPALGGTCAVCPGHLPPVLTEGQAKKPFLIAHRSLTPGLVAEVLSG